MTEYQNYTEPVPSTNRQIALLAAAQVFSESKNNAYYIVEAAKEFLRFLESES